MGYKKRPEYPDGLTSGASLIIIIKFIIPVLLSTKKGCSAHVVLNLGILWI
jgi:hypothetical protein